MSWQSAAALPPAHTLALASWDAAMAEFQEGDLVAGRYRIERLVGVGGVGSVFEAVDITSHQKRALKVLHPLLVGHGTIQQRFLREAQAAQALSTAHAVKVEACDVLPDGTPFLVMEYLAGNDLARAKHEAGGTVALDRALSIACQVATALGEAHERGILHRDLKPENIFLIPTAAGDIVKVVDFGISKMLSRQDEAKLTRTGLTVGTPQYMPIEQLRGTQDLDARVDVYALGVILYELLAGVRPYDGATHEQVILKIATGVAPTLGAVVTGLPPAVIQAVDRAMARDKEQRFRSMAELRNALLPFTPHPCPLGCPHCLQRASSAVRALSGHKSPLAAWSVVLVALALPVGFLLLLAAGVVLAMYVWGSAVLR